MKVIFDSNTWRLVVDPESNVNDRDFEDLKVIRDAVAAGKIEPYLSETIFTIEAIVRKHRQGYFAKYNPKVTHKTTTKGSTVKMSFTLGSNEDDAILFTPEIKTLKDYFDKAVAQGYRIVRLPMIGGLVNPEVDKVLYLVADFDKYYNKAVEVAERIQAEGAGFSWLKALGEKYDTHWLKGIKKSPVTEANKIAKAAAEWADGDSVAICIGLECDYFCTRDEAKGAGQKSVFSKANMTWLKNEYNFQTIDIPSLAEKVK